MAAAGAALRLRLLYRMLRVGELLALVVFLSWSSSRVPAAAAAVVRLAGSLLLNARFVFVLGNAIVLLLLALSRHDLSISSSNQAATAAAAVSCDSGACPMPASTAPPAACSFPAFIVPQPSPPPPHVPEAPAATAPLAPVVPCAPSSAKAAAAAAVFEDKQTVRVNKARAPRRSRSEKMSPRGAFRRAASPELRRSESDNGRRRRSSVTARDAEAVSWGADDAEEFRRTVEAFIAKQTRFHREESMTMSIVTGVGHGEVAPAITGALAVVE
ncbi:translation initiation factor IF-2-like [Oryza brachyantha]|uniref:translation initiation factor IF-2-like n=1 Tax=Oryza brachyantha TaxID=4533 RepID=UPI001AD96CDB|nr:translation initiation factor IF-2-like [Oryza brachyantha]